MRAIATSGVQDAPALSCSSPRVLSSSVFSFILTVQRRGPSGAAKVPVRRTHHTRSPWGGGSSDLVALAMHGRAERRRSYPSPLTSERDFWRVHPVPNGTPDERTCWASALLTASHLDVGNQGQSTENEQQRSTGKVEVGVATGVGESAGRCTCGALGDGAVLCGRLTSDRVLRARAGCGLRR